MDEIKLYLKKRFKNFNIELIFRKLVSSGFQYYVTAPDSKINFVNLDFYRYFVIFCSQDFLLRYCETKRTKI